MKYFKSLILYYKEIKEYKTFVRESIRQIKNIWDKGIFTAVLN